MTHKNPYQLITYMIIIILVLAGIFFYAEFYLGK